MSSVTHGIIWLTRPTWYLVRRTVKILALADILILRAYSKSANEHSRKITMENATG
jgi:hypothetical protein